MKKLLLIVFFGIFFINLSVFGENFEKHLTKDQYIAWKNQCHQFIYKNTIVCGDYNDAVKVYNMLAAHEVKSALHYMRNNECHIVRTFHGLTIEKIYPNGKIASAWLDYSERINNTIKFKLIKRYVYIATVHDKKELENKFIK